MPKPSGRGAAERTLTGLRPLGGTGGFDARADGGTLLGRGGEGAPPPSGAGPNGNVVFIDAGGGAPKRCVEVNDDDFGTAMGRALGGGGNAGAPGLGSACAAELVAVGGESTGGDGAAGAGIGDGATIAEGATTGGGAGAAGSLSSMPATTESGSHSGIPGCQTLVELSMISRRKRSSSWSSVSTLTSPPTFTCH